jgi:sortase A
VGRSFGTLSGVRRLVHLTLTGALALGVAACGGDDEAAGPTPMAATTTTERPTTTSTTSTTSTTTSTTSTTTTTTVAPTVPATAAALALPTPIAPPPEDGRTEDTFEVGTIEIPEIGLRAAMWEGIRLSTLDRGPGHWPGTAMPGEAGNVVVAAHRTSHNAEFRHLDDLAPGDEVVMSTLAGRFVYRVVGLEIVGPDALWIVDQTPAATATLFACHPPGSVRERIVAHLELVA